MMAAGILTLDNLECHFNWKPEVDSTKKEKHIQSVIEKTKNKLKRHPQFTIAYRCTLAYLHTLPNVHDFNEAYDFLDGTKIELPTKDDLTYHERWLGCDFIVRANRLKLRECEMVVNEDEMDNPSEELIALTKLWADDTTKAAVYAVKGVTFNCFGPKKYHVAVEAFKSAIELTENGDVCTDWQMFDWLWGCAFTMSRITRRKPNLEARPEEMEFWKKAFNWKDSKHLTVNESLFYANFAETIMPVKSKRTDCKQLIEKAFSLWQKLSSESKLLCNLVLIIAVKFCDKYPKCSKRIKRRLKSVNVLDYLGDDDEIYRRLAKLRNYEEENLIGIDILERYVKKIGHSSNIWFDIQLQNRYAKVKSEDWICRNYSSLLLKYKPYPESIALILLNRSRWIFYKEVSANGLQNFRRMDISVLDECAADIIWAKSKHSAVSIDDNYRKKFNAVLKTRKNERPEYLAWFRYNFLQNSNINEIIELYMAAFNGDTSSEKRKVFVKENLGLVYLNNRQFSEAIATLREVAPLNVNCKLIFTRAVVEYPSRSLDELCVCLDLGSLDVITIILDLLETEKKQINLTEEVLLLDKDFFDGGTFFFSKVNYEICARIQILLENENSFFIDEEQIKNDEFKNNVSDRLNKFLEIPSERPTVVAYHWRWARLELTKSYICRQSVSDTQNVKEMEKLVNTNILQVFHESRSALDPCITKYFNISDKGKSFCPQAFQRMTKNESECLLKKAGNRTNCDRQRPEYLLNRMKKEWLPSARVPSSSEGDGTVAGLSSASGSISDEGSRRVFKYEVIEGLLRDGFKEKGKISEEILKFVAKREYHIITKEAAWHAIWIETDNYYKHHDHARDIEEFQRKLNQYRDITGLTETLTVYDAAHRAAEFAEQTFAVFVKNQERI